MRASGRHLVALAWSVVAATAMGADTLADCRAITDDDARLACYDALPGPAEPATTALAAAAPAAGSAPSAVEMFGRESETLRRAAGAQLEEITATVVDVQSVYGGKVVVQLDNGQVWTQVDTTPIDLRSGEAVRIRRAALGSFLLSEVGRNRSVRVRRAN